LRRHPNIRAQSALFSFPQPDEPTIVGGSRLNAPESDLSPAAIAAALTYLTNPAVAGAVLFATDASSDHSRAHALRLFTETITDLAPRPARPAVAWLRGKAHEFLGDAAAAEAAFTFSNTLDPRWGPTLASLARFASDRGDAPAALELLHRGGLDDDSHGLAGLVTQFLPDPGPKLGRNEPCWCGSGRKYKVCHLRRLDQLPLERRAEWLYQKACMDLAEGPGSELVIEFARIRAAPAGGGDQALQWAVQDPLIYDIALFEAGGLHDFLATRGHLLPDDEQLLAAQWELIDRSIYEIVDVEPGTGMTMRDVRTGDITAVQERSASRQVRAGQLYCAHLLPAGDTTQIFGGLEPLSTTTRDELIALLDDNVGPAPLLEALSARLAPPTLHNTEGEPLVTHEATVRISDPAAISPGLDRIYRRTDDDPTAPRWVEEHAGGSLPAIRVTLTLDGDHLRVNTNSDRRFEWTLTILRELDPAATLLSHQRTPASSLAPPTDSAPPPPDPLLSDPAVIAAVHDTILKYEAAWLDESIPALGGLTPR
ncbi:MAG: SEC-C domain-containing protein, partial [Actinobacteria bacterium]|nr:SEC-C domain-containing protein [Actinomycetota bacterium]